jgi:hypothetical protein
LGIFGHGVLRGSYPVEGNLGFSWEEIDNIIRFIRIIIDAEDQVFEE